MNIKNWKTIQKSILAMFIGILILVGGATFASAQKVAKNIKPKAKTTKTKTVEPQKAKTLYERLGGYDAISAVVESFADKLFADPIIGKFFVGMGTDTRKQFKQKNKNLVCNVTGGKCDVISRTAKVVHGGLGITEKDFGIVVQHLVDTLNEFKVPEAEQKELLAIIGSLKPDIVEKK